MHIQVSRQEFLNSLALIQGVVETKKTLPILSHLLLEAEGERIFLFGTDLDIGIHSWLEADVAAPGAVAISAKKLYEIVRELPEAPIELKVNPDLVVSITCLKSEFQMRGLPKEDFPHLPRWKEEGEIILKRKNLREMMRKTLFATSTDQTRYTLTGVLFQLLPQEIRMVATDGHRLALIIKGREEIQGAGTLEALIPRKAVVEALKMLKDEEGEVRLQLQENQLLFELGRHLLICRLIEGQFPNYQQVIPKKAAKTLRISRELFQGALRRTSAIMGDRIIPTVFELRPGGMQISCVNTDVGEAREELDADYRGEGMSIGFNTRYILEFLTVVEEDEIQVQLNDPLSPALFQPVGEESYLYVVMPMRI